jgi:hypothetical protein
LTPVSFWKEVVLSYFISLTIQKTKNLKNLSALQSVCIFTLFLTIVFNTQNISAQGCVAIKGNATSCMSIHADSTNVSGWQFASSGRYFRSFTG